MTVKMWHLVAFVALLMFLPALWTPWPWILAPILAGAFVAALAIWAYLEETIPTEPDNRRRA